MDDLNSGRSDEKAAELVGVGRSTRECALECAAEDLARDQAEQTNVMARRIGERGVPRGDEAARAIACLNLLSPSWSESMPSRT